MFDEWFFGLYGPFSLRAELFYEELGELESPLQHHIIGRWLKYAFEAGMDAQKEIDHKRNLD